MPWTQQPKTERPLRPMRTAVPNVRVDRPKHLPDRYYWQVLVHKKNLEHFSK